MRGINPSDLKEFDFQLAEDTEKPEVENPGKRFSERFPRWLAHAEDFDQRYPRRPLQHLWEVFSLEENYRLWFQSAYICPFGDHLRESKTSHRAIFKINNSMWRWGFHHDWNQVVRVLNGLKRFKLGNLEVRLDFASGHNDMGRTVFHRTEKDGLPKGSDLYLDSSMGFIIYHKGKPVGVIGFSPVLDGVLFQQVQMFKPKGNRWLYKLDKPLFEMAAEAMYEAFSDCGSIFLVDGESAFKQICRVYGSNGAPSQEAAARIQALYDQPLQNLVRGEAHTQNGTLFHKLVRA